MPGRSRASKVFSKLDADGSGSLQNEEIKDFIESHHVLWDKLSKSLKQNKEVTSQAATLVAMELATGLSGKLALNFALTKEQFKQFHKQYVQDPDGFEDFFHRIVFAAFDTDGSGELDDDELDRFLDGIYSGKDVKKGRVSLYKKEEMKALIMEKHDKDGDGALTYQELQGILADGAKALDALKKEHEESGARLSEIKEKQEMLSAARKESTEEDEKDGDVCGWIEKKLTGKNTGGMCKKACVIS